MTEQMKLVAAFLIGRGYTRDESRISISHIEGMFECEVFYKRNDAPCETNDKAQFRIRASRYLPEHSILLELSIRTEQDSKWWDLRVYNLSFEKVQQELTQLEDRLVKFSVPEKRKVYSLLYMDNDYNQPPKAFSKLWFSKPTLEQVQNEIGEGELSYSQYFQLFIEPIRFTEAGTDYWIEIIEE